MCVEVIHRDQVHTQILWIYPPSCGDLFILSTLAPNKNVQPHGRFKSS